MPDSIWNDQEQGGCESALAWAKSAGLLWRPGSQWCGRRVGRKSHGSTLISPNRYGRPRWTVPIQDYRVYGLVFNDTTLSGEGFKSDIKLSTAILCQDGQSIKWVKWNELEAPESKMTYAYICVVHCVTVVWKGTLDDQHKLGINMNAQHTYDEHDCTCTYTSSKCM